MKFDYIIVGMGIAGTTLARALTQQHKTVAIIDNNHRHSSSMQAAGIVNPITGRRYVKTWLCDTLIPFARQYYKQAEIELQTPIFHDKNISFIFSSVAMQNDWMLRPAEQNSIYIEQKTNTVLYKEKLYDVVEAVEFCGAGRVDMPNFINTYKKNTLKEHHYINETFDFDQLEIQPQLLRYKDISAEKIVFCEGAQAAARNPFFSYLPFNLAKGEILLIRIPNYPFNDKLLKHKQLFIVKIHKDLYWAGSSYLRDFEDDQPTVSERQYLENQLKEILRMPFEVVEHWAGIRPTVRDRRPFLGQHPTHPNLFIFNGFGAKGSYLAPYFAQHFTDFLLDDQALMPEVDIRRYEKLLKAR